MASVTVPFGSAYNGAVEWTFTYDDTTLLITSVTCVNGLTQPVTCTFLWGHNLNRSQTETIQPGTTTADVSSFSLNLVPMDGGLAFGFPFSLQE